MPCGPCGPIGPGVPFMAIKSRGWWEVLLFSLLSDTMLIPVWFGMSAMPLLVITPSIQSTTNPVKSTATNPSMTISTFVASSSISCGAVCHVTVASFHAPRTAATSKDPLLLTLLAYKNNVAFVMLVPAVPSGNVEKSNFSRERHSFASPSGPLTPRELDDMIERGLAAAIVASSVRRASCAYDLHGQSAAPAKSKKPSTALMNVSFLVSIECFTVSSSYPAHFGQACGRWRA